MTKWLTMTAKLVAEEGVLKELVLSFDAGDQWIIGRDPDASQLIVEDLSASRKHAICRRTPDGITIENLSHTNPTLVNEEKIEQPHLLHQGDMVKIGNSVFCYYEETGSKLIEEHPSEVIPKEEKVLTSEDIIEKLAAEKIPAEEEMPHPSIFEEEADDSKQGVAQVNFDLTETGRWLLKVVGGPNSGAEFSMQAGNTYTLGTDPNTCDIVFYDNTVSRQHVRITVGEDDSLTIEDLKSRNGTRIDGEQITEKKSLLPNTFVALGTTSFVIYDREGEMQTIISPLMPSIVKVLQKEESASDKGASAVLSEKEASAAAAEDAAAKASEDKKKPKHTFGAFILIWVLIGLFALVGLAVQTLFLQEPVIKQDLVDPTKVLTEALASFPGVKFSFNKTTGRLLLVGHVLTVTDKNQLIYNLQGLKFIRDMDDSGVIIDEYVWTEANQVLSKNPSWKGVTVHSPSPGRFVLSGYLHNRSQAEQVWDYLTRNFPYLDLLENKIVVEEDVVASITNALRNQGFNAVKAEMVGGELTLTGNIQIGQKAAFDELTTQFREIPGIRTVNALVNERERNEAVINISDRYLVTGSSRVEGKLNVVINGRILAEGDVIDGMKVTNIQPSYVLLEKNGIVYRIDLNQ